MSAPGAPVRRGPCSRTSRTSAHIVEALDAVLRRFGGTARRWRFERMAGAVDTRTGAVLASFAAVAKYYGVAVDVCPPRAGNRKGVVEAANRFIQRRWWRSAQVSTAAEAQAALGRFLATTTRAGGGSRPWAHSLRRREALPRPGAGEEGDPEGLVFAIHEDPPKRVRFRGEYEHGFGQPRTGFQDDHVR